MSDPLRSRRGFTMVEIMIVVAIIGLLAVVVVPKINSAIRSANEGATKGKLGAIRSALVVYYGDNEGQYPADLTPFQQAGNSYMEASFLPIYTVDHGSTSNIDYVDTFDATGDSGALVYENAGADKGRTWIGCSHNDAKGKVWNQN
ncbi:MAG: type II secretion system protein [Elusimicrobia bacterium]|nr:type II secretion system protein [Elusimicrobiota bacterium]